MNTDRFAKVDWISEECKEKLNESIEQLGSNFEEMTRLFLLDLEPFLKSSTGFKIRLVIDTSDVISEVIHLLGGGRPFLSALIESPFLELVAPPDIIQELNDKIPERITDPSERKIAFENAQKLIDKIQIRMPSDGFGKIKAEAIMGLRDPNDVSFIQIAIEMETHGVLSRDKKHFSNIPEIKRWELGEAGRVLTEMNRGALSLWIVGIGIPGSAFLLIQMLMGLVRMAVEASLEIGAALFEGAKTFLNSTIDGAKKHPLLTIGVAGLTVAVLIGLWRWEPSRLWIEEQIKTIDSFAQHLASAISKLMLEISKGVEKLAKACYERMPILLEWIECLGYSSMLLFERVEEFNQL